MGWLRRACELGPLLAFVVDLYGSESAAVGVSSVSVSSIPDFASLTSLLGWLGFPFHVAVIGGVYFPPAVP